MEEGKNKNWGRGNGWKVDRLSKQVGRATNSLVFLVLGFGPCKCMTCSYTVLLNRSVNGLWMLERPVLIPHPIPTHSHSLHPYTYFLPFTATLWLPNSLGVHFWEFSSILSWSFPFPHGDAHSFH